MVAFSRIFWGSSSLRAHSEVEVEWVKFYQLSVRSWLIDALINLSSTTVFTVLVIWGHFNSIGEVCFLGSLILHLEENLRLLSLLAACFESWISIRWGKSSTRSHKFTMQKNKKDFCTENSVKRGFQVMFSIYSATSFQLFSSCSEACK